VTLLPIRADVALALTLALVLIAICVWLMTRRSGRKAAAGFRFVYVNDDGTVCELRPDEIEYLNTKFVGSDGARPYIKRRFWDRTPDGKLGGYLPRTRVPRGVFIANA
jgi:hypothetical protein